MAVHVALLAVPAMAGGFQFAFLLWPFNLALRLARHLPRACITLGSLASFYAAELRHYVNGLRRGVQQQAPPQLSHQYASLRSVRQMVPEEVVAHAMIALIDISY